MPIITFDPDADGSDQDAASGIHARDCDCPQCEAATLRARQEEREGIAESIVEEEEYL